MKSIWESVSVCLDIDQLGEKLERSNLNRSQFDGAQSYYLDLFICWTFQRQRQIWIDFHLVRGIFRHPSWHAISNRFERKPSEAERRCEWCFCLRRKDHLEIYIYEYNWYRVIQIGRTLIRKWPRRHRERRKRQTKTRNIVRHDSSVHKRFFLSNSILSMSCHVDVTHRSLLHVKKINNGK